MIARRFLVAGLVALTLSGCGRKGPLEPPPGAAIAKPVIEPGEAAKPGITTPGSLKPKKKRTTIVPPKDPFILDPIL